LAQLGVILLSGMAAMLAGAASLSFVAFAAGSFLPLVPFLLLNGYVALYATIGVTAVALFGIGTLGFFIGRWLGVNVA
jgi:VIT1/CCC1 family predicted Fe2+/Mn2+ transporter